MFLKVKKFHFYKKQEINTSASVMFGLVRLIIIDGYNISRGLRLLAAHVFNLLLCSQGILLWKKLSDKQSGSVIFGHIRPIMCDCLSKNPHSLHLPVLKEMLFWQFILNN